MTMPSMLVSIGFLLLFAKRGHALHILSCRTALGMQTGEIPDDAITASSSLDPLDVGPTNARIRTEASGGAWCPKEPVSKNVYEYLQIDFGELKAVTLVETQGRFGNGQGQEYVEQYKLNYQREDNGRWFVFQNRRKQEIFQGNANTYIAELRDVDPPIIARRLRIVPYSLHPKSVCLRAEIYGCTWKDGVVSYSMHQGEKRSNEVVDLHDLTYDGVAKDGRLSGGLGQLVDGEEGQSNFRLDPRALGVKGYDWVGWKNDSFAGGYVEIVFQFDAVRNFSTFRVHCNNMFSKDVRVFRTARVDFSGAGRTYTSNAVDYRYMRDSLIEYARPVVVPLQYNVGRFVKVQLYFDSRWLMVSEVQFESEYVSKNQFPDDLPNLSSLPSPSNGIEEGGDSAPINQRSNGSEKSLNGSSPPYQDTEDPASNNDDDSVDTSKERHSPDNDEYVGIVIGILLTVILLLFAVAVVVVMRHRRSKYGNNHRVMKCVEPPRHIAVNMNSIPNGVVNVNGKLVNDGGNMYNFTATSDVDSDPTCCGGISNAAEFYKEPATTTGKGRRLPELPATPDSSDTCTSKEYGILNQMKTTLIVNNCPPPPPAPPASSTGTFPTSTLPGGGTLHRKFQPPNNLSAPSLGGNGGRRAAAPGEDGAWNFLPNVQGTDAYALTDDGGEPEFLEDFSVIEFSRENLKFVEKLGEGQFGEVHLCEVARSTDYLPEGRDALTLLGSGSGSRSVAMVAVKMLRKNADEQARAAFYKEAKIMSRLNDQNIVRLLGVCTTEEPYCVVVEYMKYGDLSEFLRRHVPEGTVTKSGHAPILSYGSLIYIASQIASGMKFMERSNVVHRDLSTRNCLVGDGYVVKISDFGMSCSLYGADYYAVEEGRAALPVRWMAWESVILGKFSPKSDVWSFGVTTWEILTFAREQPLDSLTDQQVIDNFDHHRRGDGLEIYPLRPAGCPREIYDLMRECWNRDEAYRPTFREIHMFLQRKNMGYTTQSDETSFGTFSSPRNAVVVV